MPQVDFAIIGVPKSATTFLHWALRSHPDVWMQDNENSSFNREGWESKLAPVLNQAAASGRKLVGVKRPDMLFNAQAALRMKQHNPSLRAIAVLRHPVERAVAHYFHLVRYSFLPLVDFETGIRRLLSGDMQNDWPRGQETLGFSLYGEAMHHYREALGEENVLFVTHDDVKANSEQVLRLVCGFIGLEHDGKIEKPAGKPQKVIYAMERLRFLRHGNEAAWELDEFARAQRFRGPMLTDHEKAWDWMVRQFDSTVMAAVPNVPPRLGSGTWEMLYAHFRDDIARVEKILGRGLPSWHQNPLPEEKA